jgi:hypothetical protein
MSVELSGAESDATLPDCKVHRALIHNTLFNIFHIHESDRAHAFIGLFVQKRLRRAISHGACGLGHFFSAAFAETVCETAVSPCWMHQQA